MKAQAKKIDDLYCVVLGNEVIKTYSSPANAKLHRDAINFAITNPPGLNQKPAKNT